jgi:cytosine/adenosine deaminase-related metal-dependent hydrolase
MKQIITSSLGLADAFAAPQVNFAVVVEGNRIIDTGEANVLQQRHPDAHTVDGAGCVLMPAFVNSHDHGRGLGTASRGIDDDILETWLLMLRAQPDVSPYLAAALDGLRLAHSGVCLTAHSHNPLSWLRLQEEAGEVLRGYRDAGVRVAFHLPIVDQNMLVYEDEAGFVAQLPDDVKPIGQSMLGSAPIPHDDYFAACEALFAQHHAMDGWAQIQGSPAGGQWCSDALILRCVDFAKRHNTRVQMHLLETFRQKAYAQRAWGKSFARHLDEIGALGPWLTLAHMVWVDEDDLALLAERGVCIAHNPGSNLRLRSGIAPLNAMHAAGIVLGVGLDGHGLDDDQDYLRELRLAHTLAAMRAEMPDASIAKKLDATDVLHMGTAGGAAATFGRDVKLGVLHAGALADLVLIDLTFSVLDLTADAHRAMLPALLLRLVSSRHVRDVMVNGEWSVRGGRHVQLHESTLLDEIKREFAEQDLTAMQQRLEEARRIIPHVRAWLETSA